MIQKITTYLFIFFLSIALVCVACVSNFFSPNDFRKYDQPSILFLIAMYVLFYIIHFLTEKKCDQKKLIAKDLVFLVLKFLILLFYVVFRQYYIKNTAEKKFFLLHFLIYALILFTLDTIIYYQLINKKNEKSNG